MGYYCDTPATLVDTQTSEMYCFQDTTGPLFFTLSSCLTSYLLFWHKYCLYNDKLIILS